MCVYSRFSIAKNKQMWEHVFRGDVSLLPSPPAVFSSVSSNWDWLKPFLKQHFFVSHRWTLTCVRFLKLGRKVSVWETARAESGIKQSEPLKTCILHPLEHTVVIKGRLTRVCTDPTLWLAWLPPFTPSASDGSHETGVRHRRCPRAFPWGTRLLPASQPGCNEAAYSFAARHSQISGGFGLQTRPETFHVLSTVLSVCLHCTCSLLWLHLTTGQRASHLFKIHRSMARSQPGRKRWRRPSTYQDKSDHFRKITDSFVLFQIFFPLIFNFFSCWSKLTLFLNHGWGSCQLEHSYIMWVFQDCNCNWIYFYNMKSKERYCKGLVLL